jgi:hypothetical protein
VGGPADVCKIPGQRIGLQGDWRNWIIHGEAQAKAPPRGPKRTPLVTRPFIIRSGLPKDPKLAQDITVEIAFPGEPAGCYGKIPVAILDVNQSLVTILTKNSGPVQIAPDICPDIWVLPYQVVTIYR